jgi:hypothetical protein
MRMAEAFHRCALSYAEKVAPREYGQLIKFSNPESGVVNYAVPAVQSKPPLKAIDAPSTPAIEAHFDELDPT